MVDYPDGRKYNPQSKLTKPKPKTKQSKYNAVKTILDDIKFDSKKEARRYIQLKQMERAGLIKKLRLQVPFVLVDKSCYGREIKYVADFVYIENGAEIVEDVKGVKTPVYKLKKRLMAERYGIKVKET
ncbi:DUF1064 domain-containing protein [Thomasclavelia cocleata]|uniref:DUF1064 domain-containing protein n=1 Tax=Thomasclavelia cocleata TaxID=69824 RepID=UPI0025789CDF|nr:DUF1064 domain-containing protein [Thomasclavelia cocleata]